LSIDFTLVEPHPDDELHYGRKAPIVAVFRGNLRSSFRSIRANARRIGVSDAVAVYCIRSIHSPSTPVPEGLTPYEQAVVATVAMFAGLSPQFTGDDMAKESYAAMSSRVIDEVISEELQTPIEDPPEPEPAPVMTIRVSIGRRHNGRYAILIQREDGTIVHGPHGNYSTIEEARTAGQQILDSEMISLMLSFII
jgi:hypothetical protein